MARCCCWLLLQNRLGMRMRFAQLRSTSRRPGEILPPRARQKGEQWSNAILQQVGGGCLSHLISAVKYLSRREFYVFHTRTPQKREEKRERERERTSAGAVTSRTGRVIFTFTLHELLHSRDLTPSRARIVHVGAKNEKLTQPKMIPAWPKFKNMVQATHTSDVVFLVSYQILEFPLEGGGVALPERRKNSR